jgi:hypothetical protein
MTRQPLSGNPNAHSHFQGALLDFCFIALGGRRWNDRASETPGRLVDLVAERRHVPNLHMSPLRDQINNSGASFAPLFSHPKTLA